MSRFAHWVSAEVILVLLSGLILIQSGATGFMLLPGTAIAQEPRSANHRSNGSTLPDLALQPPRVITNFGPDHAKGSRGAQGVPAIERSAKGRLWAAWYTGKGKRGVESSSSYVVLTTSGDNGKSWSEKMVVKARKFVHTYDPCLWRDPQQRLWFFWAQSAGVQDGRMGVWAMTTTVAPPLAAVRTGGLRPLRHFDLRSRLRFPGLTGRSAYLDKTRATRKPRS